MAQQQSLNAYFEAVARKESSSSRVSLQRSYDFLFQDVTLEDRTVLDIGAGIGLHSFYVACQGARRVVALEPGAAGSREGYRERFVSLRDRLNLHQVTLWDATFQDYDSTGETFDIILLRDSVNHLDEEACIKLDQEPRAVQTYQQIFKKLSDLTSPGGRVIITDASRYNFFSLCHLRNPLMPTVEWHKHQPPERWWMFLRDAGFVQPRINWSSHPRLGAIGQKLFGNRYAAYFTFSHFRLSAQRGVTADDQRR